MSSGIKWDERRPYTDPENSETKMFFAPDSYRYILEQPMATDAEKVLNYSGASTTLLATILEKVGPGKVWNYSSGSTTLLGAILEKVSGKPLLDFARESLFTPLGITDVEWTSMPNGQPAGHGGLRLRPRDLAKIGQLVLNQGSWNAKRIISTTWLKESIEPRFTTWYGNGYGYQWWLGRSPIERQTIEWIAGLGFGGQCLFILPKYQAVVVITAGLYKESGERVSDIVINDILNKYVLPALGDK
jgi:CubicO group peptidase (beta-lactamase class C family)